MGNVKKGVVISGGAAFGAYGGGTLAAMNKQYDVAVGISTGAIMSPLVVLNEYDQLQKAYTSVTNKDIFDRRLFKPTPVKSDGSVNAWAIILAILFKRKSIGTSKSLRKTINKFINESHYNKIQELNKKVIVGTQNLSEHPSRMHYFNSTDSEFEDFKDWIWSSANFPLFMSLITKEYTYDGQEYNGQWTDGGLTELVGIDQAFNEGCREIDVIIHREIPEHVQEANQICTSFDNAEAVVEAMRFDIEFENLFKTAKHYAARRNTEVNLIFLPRKLAKSGLVFNKKQMKCWWDEGFDTAFDEDRIITFKPKPK